jgi:signal transduction histidine kinase
LALARRFARAMHGELTVESALGVGSTFTLTLPAWVEPAEVPSPADRRE